jgi:hypothetical protein
MTSPVPWADARAKLTAASLGVAIEWPNELFLQPADNPALWLSVEMVSGLLMPIEVGGTVWQEEGTLYVDVLAPINGGTADARALAKQIVSLFRQLPPQPVIYTSAAIGGGAPSSRTGAWWSLPVSIDWRYQDIGP